jgi:hypothetical protein
MTKNKPMNTLLSESSPVTGSDWAFSSVGGVVPTSNIHPLHRELKRGTLSGILCQAGVGAADFNAALG